MVVVVVVVGGGGMIRERVSVRQLGGPGSCSPRKELKLKSSEMARNASKTVITDVNF